MTNETMEKTLLLIDTIMKDVIGYLKVSVCNSQNYFNQTSSDTNCLAEYISISLNKYISMHRDDLQNIDRCAVSVDNHWVASKHDDNFNYRHITIFLYALNKPDCTKISYRLTGVKRNDPKALVGFISEVCRDDNLNC